MAMAISARPARPSKTATATAAATALTPARNDPLKCHVGQCGCGVEDVDFDGDGVADCNDACPLDPGKAVPGCCGCGFADDDNDGDGYPECEPDADVQPDVRMCPDTCPGADDGLFGPCEADVIPTVSGWGLAILAVVLLVLAKLRFGRRARGRGIANGE